MLFTIFINSLTGFGLGLALLAVQAVLVFNFDKRVGVAVALANTGAGVGLFTLPPLVQLLIGHLGWRGATMILAAIYANICVCGSVLVPTESELTMRKHHREHRHKTDAGAPDGGNRTDTKDSKGQRDQQEPLEDRKDESAKYEGLQTTIKKCPDDKQDTEAQKYQRLLESSRQDLPEGTKDIETYQKISTEYPEDVPFEDSQITSRTEGTSKSTGLFSRTLLKLIKSFNLSLFYTNPNFIGFFMCGLFIGIGYSPILIYIAPKAVDEGMSKLKASYIMSIVGIFQVCGRLIGGGIADRKTVSPSIACGITTILAGGFTFLFPVNNSFAYMATVAFLFGMSSGVGNCLHLLVAKEYVGVMQVSGAFAWFQFAWAFGAFAGIYFQGE